MTSQRSDEEKINYLSHLDELRTRLLFSLLAVGVGLVAGWLAAEPAYRLLAGPIIDSVNAHHGQVITLHPAEVFFTRMKMALVLGVMLASPVIVAQLWGFIRPALTPREQRVVRPILPGVCGLFLLGAGVAYLMMPNIMTFFLAQTFPGVTPTVNFASSVDFPLKILLAFGIAFQLPVVLLGLAWLGVLTPHTLLAQWRVAMVVMAALAGIITPTGDPLTWACMFLPLLLLYFGTVALATRIIRPAGRAVMKDQG